MSIPDIDWRLIVLLVWGGGTVATYSRVLRRRYLAYRVHRDNRGRRDLLSAFGLFLTALTSALSIALVLFGSEGGSIRGLFVAISLGAFFAVGVILASEDPELDGET